MLMGENDDCDDEDDVDDDLKSEQNILSPFLLPLNLNESNRSPRRTEIKECEVRSDLTDAWKLTTQRKMRSRRGINVTRKNPREMEIGEFIERQTSETCLID